MFQILNSMKTILSCAPRRSRQLVLVAVLGTCGLLAASGVTQAQDGYEALDSLITLDGLNTPTDDLIRLATENADAIYELKKARLSMDTVHKLRPNAVVTNLEVNVASLALEAAQRKVDIIRAITEQRLAAAQQKLAILAHLDTITNGAAGDKNNPRTWVRVQDEATVEILKMILAMN